MNVLETQKSKINNNWRWLQCTQTAYFKVPFWKKKKEKNHNLVKLIFCYNGIQRAKSFDVVKFAEKKHYLF